MSADPQVGRARRWPHLLRRWSALALSVSVAAASAFVLGRSLSPTDEGPEGQVLAGRKPRRTVVAAADLSPDWTHTRNLDRRRPKNHRRDGERRTEKPRRATVKVAGGSSSARPSAPVISGSAPVRMHSPSSKYSEAMIFESTSLKVKS